MKADLAPYVRSFFEDHLSCRRNVSYNTIQSYRDSLKLLLQYASRVINKCPTRLQVPDISPEMILDFLTDLERSRKFNTNAKPSLGRHTPILRVHRWPRPSVS